MIKKISQSFIKDFRDYMAGKECGHIIREKYVNDRLLEDEEPGAKELGAYFEWIAFKSLPKSGIEPKPLYMQSKDIQAIIAANLKAERDQHFGLEVKHMYAEYRKAHKAADLVLNYFQLMGLKVLRHGVTLTKKGKKGQPDYVGTIDLEVECTKEIIWADGSTWKIGDIITIDLKYSGLLSGTIPSSNKHGWNYMTSNSPFSKTQKEYHGTQAKHYHHLSDHEFYFWVTQSNQKEDDTPDVKLLRVPVTAFMVAQHIEEGNYLYDQFKFFNGTGFVPRPSLSKCNECPLKNECADRQLYPSVETVDLNVE